MSDEDELVTAAVLEERGILKKGTAYRMAKLSLIPFAKVGPRRGDVLEVGRLSRVPAGEAVTPADATV